MECGVGGCAVVELGIGVEYGVGCGVWGEECVTQRWCGVGCGVE